MNRGELLEKLKAGESLREVDLTEADPLYVDFEGADLTGADLSRTEVPPGVTGKTWPEEAPGGCDLGRHDRLARELRTASMTRSDWPGSLRSMMFLGFAVVLVACSDPTAVPRDRPSVDGCVEWFNDQQPVGADRAVEEVFVSGQSRWEWEGRQAVCWVSLFEPECTIWSATEPTWGWTSGPVPPGDCDPVFLSVDAQHRLVDGRLASR